MRVNESDLEAPQSDIFFSEYDWMTYASVKKDQDLNIEWGMVKGNNEITAAHTRPIREQSGFACGCIYIYYHTLTRQHMFQCRFCRQRRAIVPQTSGTHNICSQFWWWCLTLGRMSLLSHINYAVLFSSQSARPTITIYEMLDA